MYQIEEISIYDAFHYITGSFYLLNRTVLRTSFKNNRGKSASTEKASIILIGLILPVRLFLDIFISSTFIVYLKNIFILYIFILYI